MKSKKLFVGFLLAIIIMAFSFQVVVAESNPAVKTVQAFAIIKADWAGTTIPVYPEGKISLKAVKDSKIYKGTVIPYDQTVVITNQIFKKGVFFNNVPANSQPMLFTISITNPGSGEVVTKTVSYKFNCTQKQCGNMGTFTWHLVSNTID